ncbi:MAG: phosphoglucosamine mutase [Nitrospira sp.]|nr:MAG: phosphoglucosamine mutase [Nitrospira sp.]
MDGDHVMAALGLDLHQNGLLAKQTLVGTVMSNFGLELSMAKAGIKLVRTPVGDRYLLERMLAEGYNFGGEQSGHFIFLDHNTTGDGLISALQILSLIKRTNKPLSELAKTMSAVPQVLLNVKVKQKPVLETIPEIERAIRESERRLNCSGRVVVRYSGTEPLLRIMVEGEKDTVINEVAEDLARVVRAHIG